MAAIHEANGQFDKALVAFEKSLEYREALVAAHPSVTPFQENLGTTYCEVAWRQHTAGQDEKAIATVSKSLAILEKLVKSEPDQAGYHADLGRSWNVLGCLRDELNDNDHAIPAFEKAIAEQKIAMIRSPADNAYKAFLSNHLENLAEQYIDLGRVDDGVRYSLEATEFRRQLHSSHPERTEYTLGLGQALVKLGDLYRHAGDWPAARMALKEARQLMESLAGIAPNDPAPQLRLAIAWTREAESLVDLNEAREALELLDKAVATASKLAATPAPLGGVREARSEALWERARLLRTLGRSAEAANLDTEREALWKGRSPAELVALAGEQASRATLIGYGKTKLSDQGKLVRRLDLNQAAANLRLAIVLGYNDFAKLRSDPHFAPLLSRDELKGLIKVPESQDRATEKAPSQ
jgi:tetratricopeptide (TPR) repeat protein